jgi:hypothetical protein
MLWAPFNFPAPSLTVTTEGEENRTGMYGTANKPIPATAATICRLLVYYGSRFHREGFI